MATNHSTQQHLIHALYIDHHHWLRNWLSKKTGASHIAAELTHDTFITLLAKENLETIIQPRAYLTTIAHGLMVNFLRRRDLEQAYIAAMVALGHHEMQSVPSTEAFMILMEKLTMIDRMLDGLPVKVKQAFLMHKLEQMTYPEIAASLGMSTVSIKKYIARAMLHWASIAQHQYDE